MIGCLRLKTGFDGTKTFAEDLFFTPPFKMYSPFYVGNSAKFISMCAAAGVLEGDENQIFLDIGNNCDVIFTDQGYQKLFNTNNGISSQYLKIKVGENASLKYLPHPIMTFGGCDHTAENIIDITSSSSLIFSEIYCCGRTAMGEEFALKRFSSRTEIKIDGKIDFIDRTLIEPQIFPEKNIGFFEGFTHTGIMYIFFPYETKMENILNENLCNSESMQAAYSRTSKGLSVRVLGTSGEDIFEWFNGITDMLS